MQAQGQEQEEAARVLGASRLADLLARDAAQRQVGLLYGVILCNARAMGEFGAVSRGLGPHPRPDQHAAAAHRDPLQRLPVRRRLRRRVAAGRCSRWSRWSLKYIVERRAKASHARRARRHEHRSPQHHQDVRRPRPLRRPEPGRAGRRAGGAARARRARARRRCCASSPAWRCPIRAACCSTARTRRNTEVRDRNVGFVFQHYALFRHMTIFENVAFGLRVRPRAHAAVRARDHGQGGTTCSSWCSSTGWPTAIRPSSPAASASASRSPARWRSSPRCCCSTSRSARSTPRCARSCAAGCAGCTTRCTSPACSSRTTRKRRWKWPTASS